MNYTTVIDYLTIAMALLLPFGVVKYLIREKYAQQVLLRTDVEKTRAIKSNAAVLKLTRLTMVITPLILILFPFASHRYAQVDLLRTITLTVLMMVTVGLEYMFRKWLHNRLRSGAD
jgi:hypothetical protein